jgi:hypothetical protein
LVEPGFEFRLSLFLGIFYRLCLLFRFVFGSLTLSAPTIHQEKDGKAEQEKSKELTIVHYLILVCGRLASGGFGEG